MSETYSLEGLTYAEVARQEYSGNNCIFSAGFVEGEDKPEVDTMYLKLEKDGVEPTILLLRPDEMQIITWLSSGVVWSHLMNHKQPDATRGRLMDNLQTKALEILSRHPEGMRASDLGWHLWGDTTESPARGVGSRGHNKFCRPAGKLLKRLAAQRKVYSTFTKYCKLWRAFP